MNALWDPKQKAAVLFRLLFISFLLWTSIHQFVYSRPGLGSAVAGVVFTVSILLMTHNSHHSFSGRFVFLYAISFLFLLGTVINSEPLVQQSSLFLSFCFLLYTVYAERCGIFIFSHNDLMVPDLIRCFLYGLDPDELDSLMPSMKGHKGIRPLVPVMLKGFLGLAIGAPVLFLVTALLSYDDTFTDLLDKILTLEIIDLDFYNIYKEGACILCALFISLYVLLLVSSVSSCKTIFRSGGYGLLRRYASYCALRNIFRFSVAVLYLCIYGSPPRRSDLCPICEGRILSAVYCRIRQPRSVAGLFLVHGQKKRERHVPKNSHRPSHGMHAHSDRNSNVENGTVRPRIRSHAASDLRFLGDDCPDMRIPAFSCKTIHTEASSLQHLSDSLFGTASRADPFGSQPSHRRIQCRWIHFRETTDRRCSVAVGTRKCRRSVSCPTTQLLLWAFR